MSIDGKKIAKIVGISISAIGIGLAGNVAIKKIKKNDANDMPDAPKANEKYREHTKRILDCAIAVPIAIVGAIPMAITALAIKLDSPGPVLFKQKRLGKDGKEFEILKFRSMCENAEHTGSGVYSEKGDSRVTRVGKIIRATSIDELPQVFNILKGDRGIIGTTKKNIDFSSVVTA